MKVLFVPTAAAVLLSTNLITLVKAVSIGTFDTSNFDTAGAAGTSTVTVNVDMGAATIGNNAGAGTDFYATHEFLDKDCGGPYTGTAPVTLSTDPDATSVSGKITSTFTNTASWNPGTYEFCMQYAIYMLGPATPIQWHVKGFNLAVDAVYEEGETVVSTSTATEIVLQPVPGSTVNTGAFAAAGNAPVLGSVAIGGDGNFAYQENLEITWLYVHELDWYDYSVNTATIIPIDPADSLQVEYPAGTAVTFADQGGSVAYEQTGSFATSNLGGKITVSVPLKAYQADLTTLKIQFTIQFDLKAGYTNPVRRNLRGLGDGDEEAPEPVAYLKSGTFNEVVTVELASLSGEDSGGSIDYKNIQVVSAMCLVGGAALFI